MDLEDPDVIKVLPFSRSDLNSFVLYLQALAQSGVTVWDERNVRFRSELNLMGQQRALADTIDHLPLEIRRAFILVHVEGFSAERASTPLAIHPTAFKRRLAHALSILTGATSPR